MDRGVLTSVIRSVISCARQDIALREHREGETMTVKDFGKECDSSCDSENENCSAKVKYKKIVENKGNFKELINLLCLENETLSKSIKQLPKNAQYTSKTTQDDLVSATGNLIVRKIVDEIKDGSKNVYSLIADEARDEGHCEQMSI